jgi:hypothetical protein
MIDMKLCYDCGKHKATVPFANSAMDMIHGMTIHICQCCYFKRVETAWKDVNENYLKLKAEQGDCR